MTTAAPDVDRRTALAGDLHRYRARLILVRLVQHALLALVVASALTAAAAIVFAPAARTALLLTAAAVLVSLIAAAIVVWASAPTLRETAAVVDRELRSNDCVVTAVECLQASDPVADLVVREAARRLAAIAPPDILPFQRPRRFAVLASATVAIAIVAALVQSRRSDDTSATAQTVRPTAGSRTSDGRGQRGGAAATQDPSRGSTAAARGETARTSDANRMGPDAGRSAAAAVSTDPRSRASESSGSPSADRSTAPSEPRSAPSETASSSVAGGRESASGAGSRGAANARGGDGRAGGGASGRGGSGGSTGLAARTVNGAGGVNSGAAPLTGAQSPNNRTVSPASTANVETAYRRAQAAIARDRIPADLRQVVQDYFTAIRRARP